MYPLAGEVGGMRKDGVHPGEKGGTSEEIWARPRMTRISTWAHQLPSTRLDTRHDEPPSAPNTEPYMPAQMNRCALLDGVASGAAKQFHQTCEI